jgi:hypothetical protein
MQDKVEKKARRKYGSIKKNFVSVENADEEVKKNVQSVEEKLKKIGMFRSLKVDTPWTTGSSDDGGNGYTYYKIQQAKKNKGSNDKYNRVYDYLDSIGVDQIDFSGMLKQSKPDNVGSAFYKKAQAMSQNQKASKPSSLFMRRKLKAVHA